MASLHRMLVVALPLVLLACDDKDKAGGGAEGPVAAVVVVPVVSKAVALSTEFVGQSEAFQKVDLRARVTGFLVERPFAEGANIAVDALLFVIDASEFIANRDAAAAKVERAEATLVEATHNLERYRILVERGTASEAKLDEAIAKEGQAKADLAAAKAELERAKLDVAYTRIASPIAGRIGRSAVDVGNLIGPDSGVLATVVTLDPIYVTFSVSERDFLNYKQAQNEGHAEAFKPRIRLANDALYAHDGVLDFVDNQVDPQTGTIKARVKFPNPDGLVLPGQFVNVLLVSANPRNELVVPQAAVQENQAGPFVLVVGDDSRVELRPIETGARTGPAIIVSSGLTEGELIIVEGVQKVRPGAKVKAVPRPAQAAAR